MTGVLLLAIQALVYSGGARLATEVRVAVGCRTRSLLVFATLLPAAVGVRRDRLGVRKKTLIREVNHPSASH
jgi:hypothetical protein